MTDTTPNLQYTTPEEYEAGWRDSDWMSCNGPFVYWRFQLSRKLTAPERSAYVDRADACWSAAKEAFDLEAVLAVLKDITSRGEPCEPVRIKVGERDADRIVDWTPIFDDVMVSNRDE